MARLTIVGDALLDRDVEGTVERLAPDAPVPVVDRPAERSRPGGAGLAAVLAAGEGHDVMLVSALGYDSAGGEIRALSEAAGVTVVDLGLDAQTPEKVRVLADGSPLVRIDRGERRPDAVRPVTDSAREAIANADAVLVSDYGRGVAAEPGIRSALETAACEVALVWDPHPLGPEPIHGVRLATPNADEAARFAPGIEGDGDEAAVERARQLQRTWGSRAVTVTISERGAVIVDGDAPPVHIPALPARGDPCGAGDRFASRAAAVLATGGSVVEAVEHAVTAASRFVDAGGARALRMPRRAVGHRIVATGGCFDLLHAGHVRTLQAARALGDRLVVCLNSDSSVRALKGPERPLVPEAARAAVLEALECVDAVVVFDERTPEAVIDRLKPAVWVKGGDYSADELPEAEAVRRHGGEVVVLQYLHGHSTTRLIEEAASGHAA